MIFQKSRYLGGRDGPHLLQSRRKHGEAVVATCPDIALDVLEYAVELAGRQAGRVVCLVAEYCSLFRMDGVHHAQSIGPCRPQPSFTVCKQPGMGYWKAAVRSRLIVLIGIEDRGMVDEVIEFSSGFGVTPGAQAVMPERMCDLKFLPVSDELVVHQAAGQPEFAVRGLVYLIIGIVAFRIPLVVEAAGLFPDAILER